MTAVAPVVCVGDALIDQVDVGGQSSRFAGGGALNAAVAITRLGHPVSLLSNIGWDAPGQWLRSWLRQEGVTLLPHPSVDFTGLALSDRTDSEPRYTFGAFTHKRRIRFPDGARDSLACASAVLTSSIAFDDPQQTEVVMDVLRLASGYRAVDPNPRQSLLGDREAYVAGIESVLPEIDLIKLAIEDAQLLYGMDGEDAADRALSAGVQAVLLTRGAAGASVFTREGVEVHAKVPRITPSIVDTMGAGDTAIASIVAWISAAGVPDDAAGWRTALELGMLAAGLTCRGFGGATSAPTSADLAEATDSSFVRRALTDISALADSVAQEPERDPR